ncbi:MAG: AbrB/MazE/SpoVT family DNA-binding domain-containing protein [Euryarchaeota archaeon]|nr:AbrB/MazE/SpoVT family DNA-binding domain-containing protein [Euryarchaeota archaeon]MBV1756188.1 AbrB/MazE/SpoVT family DNA-binding domain-containing protein [Methanobacterium sp.]
MTYKTKISKGFQTVVPSEIRKKYSIGPGDLVEWVPSNEGVKLRFRKKTSLQDITGIVETKETDTVKLKKKVQRGESV